MVDFEEANQLWHVGTGAFRVGSNFLRRTRLLERSRPVMERLMIETGETTNLAIIDHGEGIFVSQVETHEPIRAFFCPGTRGPIHASGIGKAILAHQSEEQFKGLAATSRREAFTPNTITDEAALAKELKLIRKRGWAVDNEEHTFGMRCIAAPIFNQFGEVIAGISISGPSVRLPPEADSRFGEIIAKAAEEISLSTGGRIPPQ